MILNLDSMPEDPIEALIWMGGVRSAVAREMDEAMEGLYAECRLQGRMDEAVRVGPVSRKKALALTRRWNNRLGRMVRWGDGIDPTGRNH